VADGRSPRNLPALPPTDDSPYSDDTPAPRRGRGPRAPRRGQKPAPRSAQSASRSSAAQPPHKSNGRRREPTARRASQPQPAKKKSRSRRGRGSGQSRPDWSHAATARLTSHPTHRSAYAETRRWLLAEHGPVCAYCERRFKPSEMTLDHVAPRRGQSAYDRRDNLVLACPECNAAKRDMAPIAFLLARRSRAVSLLRYGGHLSPMLIDLARSLVPPGTLTTLGGSLSDDDDEDSPYRD